MTTQNLTTDQKLDLIISRLSDFDKKLDIFAIKLNQLEVKFTKLEVKFTKLEVKLNQLEVKLNKIDVKVDRLETKVDKMQIDITDLIELTSSAMNLAAITKDRVDKLEGKEQFTPFTSGAFVA